MNTDIRLVCVAYFRCVIWVIVIAFFGFVFLAVALLLPIHRMFQREKLKNEELEAKGDDG